MRTFSFLFAVLTLLTGASQAVAAEISGTVVGDTTGVVVLSSAGQSRSNAKTSPIVGGKFRIERDPLTYPEVFWLMTEKPGQALWDPVDIFISPGDEQIEVELNTEDIEKSVVRGAQLQDEFQNYRNTVQNYQKEVYDALGAEHRQAERKGDKQNMRRIENQGNEILRAKIFEYIAARPGSFVSAYALYDNRTLLSVAQIDELIGMMDEDVRRSKYVDDAVNTTRNRSGTKAADFTLKDAAGQPVVFSELARGKVVLLDFWASWCRPCREHHPALEELYQKYKDRGFEIVGVAVKDNLKSMRNAIEQDGITWTNLLDTQNGESVEEIYNVEGGIPASVLIDRNGMVAVRDLDVSELEREIVKLLE